MKNDTKIVVHLSGGMDSTAMLIKALSEHTKSNIVPLFNDTGWAHPLTYGYLGYLSDRLGIQIERTNSTTLEQVILRYGAFPYGKGKFCTLNLKVQEIYNWYKMHGFYTRGKAQSWIGIRLDEATNRAVYPDGIYSYRGLYPRCPKGLSDHVTIRFPIVDWTTEQVFKCLHDNNIKPNPLYSEGTNDMSGCYPCMLAGRKEQERMLSTQFGQQQLERIKILEQKIGKRYRMFDTDRGICETCKT
jgi:3'-phosphoadenosine 5'-phosphosulfate sulfotransferase (PAPS reductase)/FAD synthetase